MSIQKSLFKSSFFLFAERFINRFIGLISMLILARALVPEDFGIVAIASLVVFFFDAMSDVGIREYLTQKNELSDDDINTAWTLNLLTKSIFWLVFLLATSAIVDFYEQEELFEVLLLVSLVLPLVALENVGIVLTQRALNYTPLFRLRLAEKIVGFLVMLSMLLMIQSYWVMIVSLVASFVVRVIGSYVLHDYRPKLCFKNIKEQWEYSKWLLPKGVIGFLKSEVDTIIVSKFFGMAALGGFNLVKSLISMIGRDIIQPVTEPLLAAFSKAKDDRDRLGFQIVISVWLISFLMTPIVLYCYLFSHLVVEVLYGSQWLEFIAILEILSPLILFFSTNGVMWNLLASQAKVKQLFYFEVVAMLLVVGALMLLPLDSLASFSGLRTAISFLLWFAILAYTRYLVYFSLKRLFALLTIPALTVAISGSVTVLFSQSLNVGVFLEFLLTGCVFVGLFAITSYLALRHLKHVQEIGYLFWVVESNVLSKIKAKSKTLF